MISELILWYLALILLAGFSVGKVFEHFRLPAVTGHLLAGLIIGPHMLNLVVIEALPFFNIITSIVLGIISYQIGAELFLPILKTNLKVVLSIVLIHSFVTGTLVFLGIYVLRGELWLAFALASLSIASAPAPIMAVIKRLKAKGPVKRTVIPVVGLLDIIAVVLFGLLSSVAISLANAQELSLQTAVFDPMFEVIVSIVVGAFLGLVLGLISHFIFEKLPKQERYVPYLVFVLALILISVTIAQRYHLSSILVPLSFGMVFTNFINKETYMIQNAALNNFGGPFVILFFTIAGLSLSFGILLDAGLLAVAFVLLRSVGKVLGTRLGTTLVSCPATVKKYTGWCLLPQAGVTIGMLIALSAALPEQETQLVQAVVLASIFIFQIVGPLFQQWALTKAGEVPQGDMYSQS